MSLESGVDENYYLHVEDNDYNRYEMDGSKLSSSDSVGTLKQEKQLF